MRYWLAIPAAGLGQRLGASLPKQYLEIAGRSLLEWALAPFAADPRCAGIVVALAPGDRWWPSIRARLDRPVLEVAGGAERGDSVRLALEALASHVPDDPWVLVHDAARPCLSQAMLESLVSELCDDPVGGLLAVPVADTLKRADKDSRVVATEPRDGLWQAQTPQMFHYAALRQALEAGRAVTDEAGAMEAAGYVPKLVKCDASNLKVTFPADLALAELILFSRKG